MKSFRKNWTKDRATAISFFWHFLLKYFNIIFNDCPPWMVAFPHAYSLYMHICTYTMAYAGFFFFSREVFNIQLDAGRDVTPTLFTFLFFFKNKVVSVFQTRGRGILVYNRPLWQASGKKWSQKGRGVCLNPLTPGGGTHAGKCVWTP